MLSGPRKIRNLFFVRFLIIISEIVRELGGLVVHISIIEYFPGIRTYFIVTTMATFQDLFLQNFPSMPSLVLTVQDSEKLPRTDPFFNRFYYRNKLLKPCKVKPLSRYSIPQENSDMKISQLCIQFYQQALLLYCLC